MSEPVNPVATDLPLSTPVEPVLTVLTDEVLQSENTHDSMEQASADVPRETVDPVSQAVETAVQQWIGFDPAVHAVNEDGSPRLRVDGSFARKRGRGGRKSTPDADTSGADDLFADPGNTPTQPLHVPRETPTDTPTPTPAPTLNNQRTAAMLVMACTTVMGKLVGPEWIAEKPEQKALVDATKIYLDAKGGVNVTPEMGLFIAVGMYAVPRLAHENTRSKFGKAVDWCRDRVTVIRARFSRG